MFLSKLRYSELVQRIFEKMTFFLVDPLLVRSLAHQPCWLVGLRSSTHRPHRFRNCSKSNITAAQASSGTRSCHVEIKSYRNRRHGILFLCLLIASRVFACEGEDVLVARSRQEKDVAVDCLFWRILSR